MKKNFPVTTHQVEIAPGVNLVSKTDLKGIITYANEAFIEVSGYTLPELLGQSHNLVRHPEMPPATFDEMWKVLQCGKPWQGLIKNRCKNGDFYWVDACIVPIRRNEQTIGYMSVRKRAEPQAVAALETRNQTHSTQGIPRVWRLPACLGIRFGVRAGTAFVALMMLAGGALGIGGLQLADAAFTRMYQQQFEPAIAVGQIEAKFNAIRASMLEAQLARRHSADRSRPDTAAAVIPWEMAQQQDYYDEIDEIFNTLQASQVATSTEHAPLTHALQQYITQARLLLSSSPSTDSAPANWMALQQPLLELEHKASLTAQALRQALTDAAQQEFRATLERNARIRDFAVAGIALGLLLVATVGHLFIRGIVSPLNTAIRRMNRIAEGDLQGAADLSGTGETAQLNHAATVMQQHLKVMLDEIALAARRIHQHCTKLNAALYEVTEHSEAQHDQVYSAIRALDAATAETSDLSARAERLMQMAETSDTGLQIETQELATATRLTAFGAEEVAGAMRQVAELIVENRGEAQLAWQASEELIRTARELNNLVDFFEPSKLSPDALAPIA